MGVDQRTGEGSKPRIPHVVSKSDRDDGTATTENRNLGLTPAGTISRSNLSLSLYPIPICRSNLSLPKQHSQTGPSQAHPGPIWGPTLPNWGPTGAHMKCCLGRSLSYTYNAKRSVPRLKRCMVRQRVDGDRMSAE